MNYAGLQDALYSWLSAAITPRPVIFADQDAPQPDRPYATIKVLSENKLGVLDDQSAPNNLGIASLKGHREATIQVQFYGPGAVQLALNARNSLNKSSVLFGLFWTNGIAIVSDDEVTNVSALLETEIEERALLTLVARYAVEQTDDVGYIETVEVENLIDENNGNPGNGVIITLDSL